MTPNHDKTFHDRSEYQGERGQQYRTPAGQPRDLSVAERARLMRSAGINDSPPSDTDSEIASERLA